MTTEVTEGMPQKPGVLQGDDIADMWWQGQYGRYTYDNHVIDTNFMTMLDSNEPDTYFGYKKNRYKFRVKESSDPSKWPDSKIIYESVPKTTTQQVLTALKAPAGSTTMDPSKIMAKGITKEIMVRKVEPDSSEVAAINQTLDSEEWTLFSAHTMNDAIVLVFIR